MLEDPRPCASSFCFVLKTIEKRQGRDQHQVPVLKRYSDERGMLACEKFRVRFSVVVVTCKFPFSFLEERKKKSKIVKQF